VLEEKKEENADQALRVKATEHPVSIPAKKRNGKTRKRGDSDRRNKNSFIACNMIRSGVFGVIPHNIIQISSHTILVPLKCMHSIYTGHMSFHLLSIWNLMVGL